MRKHFSFTPRIAEGAFLARHAAVRAGMDLTDGLAKDLPSLLPAKTSAMLALGALPIAEDCRSVAAKSGRPAAFHALTDGEDYELLVVVDPAGSEALETGFAEAFPSVPFTRIARIVPAAGLVPGRLYDETGVEISAHGFDHFA